jgi:hypothetical protein
MHNKMNVKELTIDQVVYINGAIETERLVVDKIGTKYITFASSKHRFLKRFGMVQRWKGKSYESGGIDIFASAEAAESYLAEKINELMKL